MRNYIFLGIIIVLIIGVIAFLTLSKQQSKEVTTSSGEQVTTGLSEGQEIETAEEGKLAPDFTLVDFEGKTVKLSDLKGKPVFIDFWTKWCPFCIDEMPEIEKIHKEFGDQIVVLGIHRTNTESASVGEDFARKDIKVTYQILQDKDDEVYKAYTPGFAGMPVAAWIDKDGVLVKLKIGPKTTEEMRDNVEAIL
ncbi:redoxin domain-containing protein [Patescibacteria group bacterium]|nr:redoxin domain-containing protein [Patescibacteria group bacterium]